MSAHVCLSECDKNAEIVEMQRHSQVVIGLRDSRQRQWLTSYF